jgi:hypothetical protein
MAMTFQSEEQRKVAGGQVRQVEWVGDDSHVVFGQEFPGKKRKYEMVHCSDAAACSFVAKVWGEVFANFHTFAIKHYSKVQN